MNKSELEDALHDAKARIRNLIEANFAAVTRAATLTTERDALVNKVEWFKARCSELEALRPAVPK